MTAPVVTGIGAVTACGATREETWRRIVAGETGIAPIESFDASAYPTRLAGEAREFDPVAQLDHAGAADWDRCHQLAVAAADEALDDAGLTAGTFDPDRAAIVIGTSLGGMSGAQEYERERLRSGRRDPAGLRDFPLHASLQRMTAATGFRGQRIAFSTACTSSTVAIGYAVELLLNGRADVVLTGGMDPLAEISFAGFAAMGNVAPERCSPFSAPTGLSVGEGAAMLLLELESCARRRGARVRARVLGYGLSADAYHPTSGDPSGRPQARAARFALSMAGLDPAAVDYVNAHGTGTAGNDPVETRALRLLLTDRADSVPVSSLKGAVGHMLGAAGALEAAMTALAIERDTIPPTANFDGARAGCDLDYVPNTSRRARLDHALSLNFAFGGNNAALVLGASDATANGTGAAPRTPVVVTGLGIVSPIGCGVAELRASLETDHSGVGAIGRFDTDGFHSRLGAEVRDFAAADLTHADLRRADRTGELTVCGAELALRDAGLQVTPALQDLIGIVAGTANGPLASCRRFFAPVAEGAIRRANPSLFPNTVFNAATGLAATHLRVKGPNLALCSGHASGLAALCVGFDLVRRGMAAAMIAGGVEELEQCTLEGYAVTGLTSPHDGDGGEEVCAPFDRRRNGLVLGEGAVFLVLESLENARARGAGIYAEMLGWAANADRAVERGADPSGAGMAQCMSLALEDAGVGPGEVDLLASAALSHPLHDRIEARAVRRVFGARRVPVTALGSRVGASAATAPLAAAAVALGMRAGFVPGGVPRREPDPECDIDTVDGAARPGVVDVALVNATSLGGSNYSIVLRRWPD